MSLCTVDIPSSWCCGGFGSILPEGAVEGADSHIRADSWISLSRISMGSQIATCAYLIRKINK